MLSDEQVTALMTEVHKEIEEAAVKASAALGPEGHPDVIYPPNAGLAQEERDALAAVEANPALVSGVRKLVATAAASPLFFDTYWTWREHRPDPGWRLDTYTGD
jgi:hypothetical protein